MLFFLVFCLWSLTPLFREPNMRMVMKPSFFFQSHVLDIAIPLTCSKLKKIWKSPVPKSFNVEWCPRTIMALQIFLSFIAVLSSELSIPVSCCSTQWAQINFSTLNQRWFNVEPQLSSTILNVGIWLRNRWFWNNDQPKINFSTTIQPKINQVWSWKINVEKWLKFGWQLVDFWLNCGWEVDYWLIIVSKLTISQPNINVDIWLRNWSVPIGYVRVVEGWSSWLSPTMFWSPVK